MKAFILLSGGVDSMACVNFYFQMGYEIECFFCDYGQPALIPEKQAATMISDRYNTTLHILKAKDLLKVPESGEICGRNALLVWMVFCKAGLGNYKIILGIHDGTGYSDCSPQFVEATNRVIDCYANGTVMLEAPFLNWHKAEIAEYCKDNQLPYELTYSCETGNTPSCNLCSSCLDRKEFFND
jgi:7-cyano-7-deazaguanine synthase